MNRIFFIVALFLTSTPIAVFAQKKYMPLVEIPGITDGGGASFSEYINFLYILSITIAALLAMIKIVIAGVKYMLTDIVTSKEEAKKDIRKALLGLLLIMGAVLILNVINPQLTEPARGVQFSPLPEAPERRKEAPSARVLSGDSNGEGASADTPQGDTPRNAGAPAAPPGSTVVALPGQYSEPTEYARALNRAKKACAEKSDSYFKVIWSNEIFSSWAVCVIPTKTVYAPEFSDSVFRDRSEYSDALKKFAEACQGAGGTYKTISFWGSGKNRCVYYK
jgi:hypothetical protein